MKTVLLFITLLFIGIISALKYSLSANRRKKKNGNLGEIDKDILAYQESVDGTDGSVGAKFVVGENCRDNGLAIMVSQVNLYGLGPGVYPHGKSPLPNKKLKRCYELIVFDDEISNEDKQGRQTRLEWLISASDDMQLAVLGSEEKCQELLDGKLKEKDLL